MRRKRNASVEAPVVPVEAAPRPPAPVNVVVIVESRRRPQRPVRQKADGAETDDDQGHPVAKTLLGFALAKRLLRPRKRPLSKRVKKAVRKGRRKVKRTARKVRRAMR